MQSMCCFKQDFFPKELSIALVSKYRGKLTWWWFCFHLKSKEFTLQISSEAESKTRICSLPKTFSIWHISVLGLKMTNKHSLILCHFFYVNQNRRFLYLLLHRNVQVTAVHEKVHCPGTLSIRKEHLYAVAVEHLLFKSIAFQVP